jgi:hypothetical protein
VIIRGNQIVAAGCLLPLSDEVATSGRMGTRHRAALTLSLESDATIIVVSEETGRISLVQDGNLRKVEPEALRQILHNVLVPAETPLVPRLFGRRRTPSQVADAATSATPDAEGSSSATAIGESATEPAIGESVTAPPPGAAAAAPPPGEAT